jgi:hypothetical protein
MARGRGGRIGGETAVRGKNALGTDEEIANRDSNTFQNPETRFGQIGTGDSGANLAEPDGLRRRVSGDAHFTKLP